MERFNVDQISSATSQVSDGFFQFVNLLEIIGYSLTAFFTIGIIFCFVSLATLSKKSGKIFDDRFIKRDSSPTKNPNNERWAQVVQSITNPNPQLWRLAIIEADTMLEEVVNGMGLIGYTFGEKLKQIRRSDVTWIDAAWEVHRLRNTLAHEGSRYSLNQREAYRAYKIYESILHDTGYLS